MSTNTLLRVEGTAWSVADDITKGIKDAKTSEDIITRLGLNYTVSAHHMKTDIDEPLEGYYAMYRDDTTKFLGHVKTSTPIITQNIDSFKTIEPLLEDETLSPVVADSYMGGRSIFGCFEFNETFKVLDDEFNHYFILVNDHLRPDGNITVINTPIRMACMNALSSALSKSTLKFKIPAFLDESQNPMIVNTITEAFNRVTRGMQKAAETMVNTQISRVGIEKVLDELFPKIEETEEGTTNHTRANQAVEMQREAFVACLNADNLANYKGTMWQVFNALTDYTQHYYRSGERGFNLGHRMTLLPGINPEATTESLKVTKFLKNMSKFERSRKVAA